MRKVILFTILVLAASLQYSDAQCKKVAKKCLPSLTPYIYTGQLNSTTLFEGESAELVMTFTGGQQYRVLACASDNLGAVSVVILDSKRKVVFNNKDHNGSPSWDLRIGATDDYTIQIGVPASTTNKAGNIEQSGCVAVLVGFRNVE